MKVSGRWIAAGWVVMVFASVVAVSQTRFTSDLSAFLPRSPSSEQRILVEQLRDGVVSRLILVALEGADSATLATSSRQLAHALRGNPNFISVSNGELLGLSRDRELVWRHRYLLSPNTTALRFSAAGLRARLEDQLGMLRSAGGLLVSRALPADPTGEALAIADQLGGQAGPSTQDGVWFSRDGERALLVAQTRAPGSDIDGQARAIAAIESAFVASSVGSEIRLQMTGPGVFSVTTRSHIKSDVVRLSSVAITLIAGMLFALYRSVVVLSLGLLPVATGAVAGVAAVGLGFGFVHGITLAFGVTLLGEGVDYAIYLFTQTSAGGTSQGAFERIWPTLRLGLLTSVCGFTAMLFSGFTGLAQLGLFAIVGLLCAAAATRWILPSLMPANFEVRPPRIVAPVARALVHAAPRLQIMVIAGLVVAAVFLLINRNQLWSTDLASLSPVPAKDQRLDQELRRDLGAPDVRHLVVVWGQSEQTVLEASERIGRALNRAIGKNWLNGFDSPAIYLPSRRTQLARQAALPPPEILTENIKRAVRGMPFRSGTFAPFIRDVGASRAMAPLERSSIEGSILAAKVDSLLVRRDAGWSAMLPLRGVSDPAAIAREIAILRESGAAVLDLKRESDALYRSYLKEALNYSLVGGFGIVGLLFLSLRSARRVFDVLAPLFAAVLVTTALLAAISPLSIFHLIGLLLVVAVGSNYSLFFQRLPTKDEEQSRTILSLIFASISTIIGFGVLSFSAVPVLHALGSTVGIGAILALLFSASFNRHARAL